MYIFAYLVYCSNSQNLVLNYKYLKDTRAMFLKSALVRFSKYEYSEVRIKKFCILSCIVII